MATSTLLKVLILSDERADQQRWEMIISTRLEAGMSLKASLAFSSAALLSWHFPGIWSGDMAGYGQGQNPIQRLQSNEMIFI